MSKKDMVRVLVICIFFVSLFLSISERLSAEQLDYQEYKCNTLTGWHFICGGEESCWAFDGHRYGACTWQCYNFGQHVKDAVCTLIAI